MINRALLNSIAVSPFTNAKQSKVISNNISFPMIAEAILDV